MKALILISLAFTLSLAAERYGVYEDKVKELLGWLKSDKLVAWKNKEKALRFISIQSTNLIADGS